MSGGFNAGFAALRIWMSFEVALCHFWRLGDSTAGGLVFLRKMESNAVPVFMLMSFFLSSEKFAKDDAGWLRGRFARIVLPFAFWSVATWLCFAACSPFTDSAAFHVTPKDLGWELLLGCSPKLCPQFWFQSALIAMTAVAALSIRLAGPGRIVHVAVGAVLASFFLQYTGLVGSAFDGFPYEAKWTLGRLSPMLAYVGTGLLLGMARGFADKASAGARAAVALLSAAVFAVSYFHAPIALPPGGYGYDGFELLFEAVLLLAVFYYVPTDALPGWFAKALKAVSSYTMGIYCVHFLVGKVLAEFAFPHFGLPAKSMTGTVVIYFLTLALCIVMARVPFLSRLVK